MCCVIMGREEMAMLEICSDHSAICGGGLKHNKVLLMSKALLPTKDNNRTTTVAALVAMCQEALM